MLRLLGQQLGEADGHTVAYQLLEKLWQEETGKPFPAIARTEKGKPYFSGEKLHFSITHTKTCAFCALSDCPVGIDAEPQTRKINPAHAQKLLSPEEYMQYENAADPNRALLTFWVLKEAEAKCTGEGIRIHPTHTTFSLTDARVQEMMDCLVAVIQE